jgi:hypothetical protein
MVANQHSFVKTRLNIALQDRRRWWDWNLFFECRIW